MKPKSKATKPPISSSKSITYQYGQVSPTEWRVAGKTMTIDEFIEDQAQQVNSTDLRVLESFSGRLLDKLKEANTDEYSGLREAVQRSSGCWRRRQRNRRKIHCRAGWLRLALPRVTS